MKRVVVALVFVAIAAGAWWVVSSRAPAPAEAAAVAEPPEDPADRFARALSGHRDQMYTGDLDEVKKRGVLRVLTRNNSTSYFLYKGVEAGFDFEVARWIAKEMGVRLEMVVAPTRRELVPWLLEGRGDVVIAGFSTEAARADRVLYTRPYIESPWVVVTRLDGPALTSTADLAGLDLLVRPSSGAMRRLRDLDLSGMRLRGAVETEESEDLLDKVGEGDATACVVEERIAKVELMHRADLRVALTLPDDDLAALAVRKEDQQLHAFLDAFLEQNRKSTDWNLAYRRYHSWKEQTGAMRDDELRADKDGRISPWDDLFQGAARAHDVDWRLLAAQAYQESRFDPDARSPAGAVGLMQILPTTAAELGCGDPLSPDAAITCSAKFLGKLMRRYTKPEIELKDRVRFALAAYNCGPAHVDDARVLARGQRLNGDRWFGDVERAMLLLSRPKFYERAKHGFARGEETVRYVSEIQTRYDAYIALTDP